MFVQTLYSLRIQGVRHHACRPLATPSVRASNRQVITSLVLVCAAFCLAPFLKAQQASGINGSVTDSRGGAVPNADVTLTDASTGTALHTVTNSTGDYTIPALQAGTYNLLVTAPGFEKFQANAIVLRVSQTERVDAKLTVGAVNSEVQVSGSEMGTVQTESPEISFTITGKQITQLVLNGRNFTQLVTLSPGVINNTGQDEGETGVAGSVEYSINGGRSEYNNWEIDGSSVMDNGSNGTLNVYPNVDAIAETEVLTSNYGAQYGRNASGTVESQTKSGTEQLHGDAFEFLRNNAFNARNYFQTSVPTYKKHDYGFTLGGPVYIPKLYTPANRKTFFFYSQEWRHEIVPGQVFNQQVPSAAERTGNFSDVCPTAANAEACPVNPATGTNYPNNQVPIDPNAQLLLNALIPAANITIGSVPYYQASPAQLTTNREELFRIDQVVTDKLRGFYRFIYDSWAQTSPSPTFQTNSFPTVQNSFAGPGVDMVASLTYAASPSLVNEFVADYTTDHITLKNLTPDLSRSGFTGGGFFDNGYSDNTLPSISIVDPNIQNGGITVSTGYFPWQNSNPTYSYRDDLTKTLKSHTLIFGASLIAAQKNEPQEPGNNQGTYSFSTSSSVTTGDGFADFLAGQVYQFTQSSAEPKYYNRYKIAEPYFQDNWRANQKLTLNLGLRLSLFGTYRDISKQAGNFDSTLWNPSDAPTIDVTGNVTGQAGALVPSTGNIFNGLVICGTNGVPAGCMTGHLFNPAPRLGFAYDVFGTGKLSVRGGYGIFFEHTNGNESNTEALEGSAPVVQTPSQFNFTGYSTAGQAGLNFPLNVTAIPTHAVWPYVQQYNLAVQGILPGHITAQVAYVGSLGRHLPIRTEYNQLTPLSPLENPYGPGEPISAADCNSLTLDATGNYTGMANGQPVIGNVADHLAIACGNDADPFRPYLGYSGITHISNIGQSEYSALQLGVSRYFGKLNGSLAYTYGHSIDDGSDGSVTEVVNSYYPQGSLASSNFDERHVLAVSLVYDLPFPVQEKVLHSVLGGWQVSDLTIMQSGMPFSVVNLTPSDNSGTGNTVSNNGVEAVQSYADVVGNIHGPVAVRHPAGSQAPRLYNADAFAAPQGLTYGDAGRNVLNVPRRTQFDMGLFKTIPIRESIHFEFRAEAFNIFNHTQWSAIDQNLGDPTFLTPTAAHNPRILQFAGKIAF